MSIAVKICGLSTSESVRATAEAGADWIGFNFVDGSPRYIDPSGMAELMPHIGASEAVGLLVDPEDAFVDRVLGTGVRTIQLHGEEPPERVSELARRVPGEVWKAIGVATRDDLKQANEYSSADRLLIDAQPPKGTTQTGGHGVPFDWSILEDWTPSKPWLLAGGLTPETVRSAVAATGACAVDVSSGVERSRGVKDAALIRAFIAAAKEQ